MPKLPELVAGLAPVQVVQPSEWLMGTCNGTRIAIKREYIVALTEADPGCWVLTTGQPESEWRLAETLDELLAQ